MPGPQPFVREAGHGPRVVCLHANASSSSQWRGLMERLMPTHHVLAPDLYGAGRSPEWPSDREIRLDDEVDLIEDLLPVDGPPVVLVGHSYGAAVALVAALRHPARVRALALYEPTLFALVDRQSPPPNGVDGIRQAVATAAAALEAGDRDAAARAFIDFWTGPGAWDAMPPSRRPAVAAAVANVRRWSHALFREATPLAAFARLDRPVLALLGDASPESAQAVARTLLPVLPRVQVQRLPGLGHMAPVTHPAPVEDAIVRFLDGLGTAG